MKIYVLAAFLIGILVGSVIGYYYFLPTNNEQRLGSKELAYLYLESSYNSTLGLCYEHPGSNTYYLSHDNALASYALQIWNREIADNISKTVEDLAALYGLETHSSGLLRDGRIDILLGYSYDDLKNIDTSFEKDYLGSILKTEMVLDTNAQVIQGYADLLCYSSLIEWRKNNSFGAQIYYNACKGMWKGNGFEDLVFNSTGRYETYKLGLFYFLNKVIEADAFEFEEELIKRAWQCQNKTSGGFRTHYYANGTFPQDSLTNTETTSIMLLANIPSTIKCGA